MEHLCETVAIYANGSLGQRRYDYCSRPGVLNSRLATWQSFTERALWLVALDNLRFELANRKDKLIVDLPHPGPELGPVLPPLPDAPKPAGDLECRHLVPQFSQRAYPGFLAPEDAEVACYKYPQEGLLA